MFIIFNLNNYMVKYDFSPPNIVFCLLSLIVTTIAAMIVVVFTSAIFDDDDDHGGGGGEYSNDHTSKGGDNHGDGDGLTLI